MEIKKSVSKKWDRLSKNKRIKRKKQSILAKKGFGKKSRV